MTPQIHIYLRVGKGELWLIQPLSVGINMKNTCNAKKKKRPRQGLRPVLPGAVITTLPRCLFPPGQTRSTRWVTTQAIAHISLYFTTPKTCLVTTGISRGLTVPQRVGIEHTTQSRTLDWPHKYNCVAEQKITTAYKIHKPQMEFAQGSRILPL